MNKTSVLKNLKEALVLIKELEGKQALENQIVKATFRAIGKKLTLAEKGLGREPGLVPELTLGFWHEETYQERGWPLAPAAARWAPHPVVWLLCSGKFLLIRPIHYLTWETGMEWKGEPIVFEDSPPELLSNMDEACQGIRWYISIRLSEIEKVDEEVEGHQEDLLYILMNIGSEFNDEVAKFIKHLSPKSMSKHGSEMVNCLIQNKLYAPMAEFAAEFGKDAVIPLMKVVKSDEPGLRKWALYTLGLADKDAAMEPLMQALNDENKEIRSVATMTLGTIKEMRAVRQLIQALKDPSPDVRSSSARSLGEIGDKAAVEPLILALKDPSPDVRSSSAGSLGVIGDKAAVEPLIQALRSERHGDVCVSIGGALAKYRDDRAIDVLMQAHKEGRLHGTFDKGPYYHFHPIVDSLVRIGSKKAIDALIKIYKKDENDLARNQAKKELEKLGKRPKSWGEKLFGPS